MVDETRLDETGVDEMSIRRTGIRQTGTNPARSYLAAVEKNRPGLVHRTIPLNRRTPPSEEQISAPP